MRKPITVRPVRNHEGDLLRQIVTREMTADWKELDWTNIEPYWLAAVQDGKILAVIQVIVGYPMGIIEFLCFAEDYSDMQRARICKILSKSAIAGLVSAGVTAVSSSVPFHNKSWKNVLKRKWGCRVYASGNLLMKRIA